MLKIKSSKSSRLIVFIVEFRKVFFFPPDGAVLFRKICGKGCCRQKIYC